uniref:Uncharacterized protein n=1 Tax=mine drainage metagenome TaxID=410659 RepID=E6QKT2_9ZZZZ
MCCCNQNDTHKMRRMRLIAMFALVLGLLPWIFMDVDHSPWHHVLDGWSGFFLGLAITLQLVLLVQSRRGARNQNG